MIITAGQSAEFSLIDPGQGAIPPGLHLGARIEVPVTRAIMSNFQLATLSGSVWTVTLDGVVAPGDYNLVWMTDDPDPPHFEAFVPLTALSPTTIDIAALDFPPVDTDAVRPTVDDVAALEQTRAVTEGGDPIGEFNDSTDPTAGQVQKLIDQATPVVLAELRPSFNIAYYEQVKHAIALYTAILIEGSHFREQVDQGAVRLWQSLYGSAIGGVKESIEEDLQHAALTRGLEPTPLPPPPLYKPSVYLGA